MNSRYLWLVFLVFSCSLAAQQKKTINLPSSKKLMAPAPGDPRAIGSLPTNIVVSPDGKYAAILENGYGTTAMNQQQGIAVLNLETNAIAEFPDARLGAHAKQSYFLGLAFSGDGKHLYASMGSLTDPTGKSAGDTGNGIAAYSFADGKVAPERFISIPPQKLAAGKRAARVSTDAPKGTAVPYPAGLAVISSGDAERLLVADNLSDDVLLIDAASGSIEKRFDVSTSEWVPASFPYAVIATKDGKRAWVSLWNASQVAELDLEKGTVARWIKLHAPKSATDPGSHPTAMALSKDESVLFVTLANADEVATVQTANGTAILISTRMPGQTHAGAYPNAVAFEADGSRLSSRMQRVMRWRFSIDARISFCFQSALNCPRSRRDLLSVSSPPSGIPPHSPSTETNCSSSAARRKAPDRMHHAKGLRIARMPRIHTLPRCCTDR